MRRNAIGQRQKLVQPRALTIPVISNIFITFRPCKHRTHCNRKNIFKKMFSFVPLTRVINLAEAFQ